MSIVIIVGPVDGGDELRPFGGDCERNKRSGNQRSDGRRLGLGRSAFASRHVARPLFL